MNYAWFSFLTFFLFFVLNIKGQEANLPKHDDVHNPRSVAEILEEDWEMVTFKYKIASFTEESMNVLVELGTSLKQEPYARAVIALAKGKEELGYKRIKAVQDLFERIGVPRMQYRVQQVMRSDLYREWTAQNIHLWIRIEKGRFPVKPKRKDEIREEKEYKPVPPPIKQTRNLMEFERMIKKNCKKIQFLVDKDDLTSPGFWALEEIVINLKKYPKFKLIIAINHDIEQSRNVGAEIFRTTLEELGLEQRQYRVRYLRGSDSKKRWKGRNEFLRMRLERLK